MAQYDDSHVERRSAERFSLSLAVETNQGPGVTRDISVSGLGLITEQPVEVGDLVQVALTMPDPDSADGSAQLSLNLRGKVVRFEKESGVAGVRLFLDEGSVQLAWAV
jgi:hypothetical protein